MVTPAQSALYATNSNRLRKAWKIARTLARIDHDLLFDPWLLRAPVPARLRVLQFDSTLNPRIPSDHTWKLAVSVARRISK